jgi:hypothetical protein
LFFRLISTAIDLLKNREASTVPKKCYYVGKELRRLQLKLQLQSRSNVAARQPPLLEVPLVVILSLVEC